MTTLHQALEGFYEKHGYGEQGGINNDWIWLKFKYFSLPIPNVKGRRENVWRHDMLHILLDYDTDWQDEAKVAAWVIGSGGWGRFYIAWIFCLSAFSVGVIFFPKSTYQAFVRGRNTRSPYLLGLSQEYLFETDIEILKKEFGFDKCIFPENRVEKYQFYVWAVIGVVWFIVPFLALIVIFSLLRNL
ncbi:hypothetical protein LV89_02933 [Arcicella aurantiaca]|uniref:Uncharacterized protein n=1 Tax=Arcicella aurantiaca TaxID=591202 RepID=A0A316EN59_9BACT|nr:hypothetical protein [Arcicella aurantiaca]PWK24420.1 hypothetical protein LV89_02933 [Arcicella aurantiaca]